MRRSALKVRARRVDYDRMGDALSGTPAERRGRPRVAKSRLGGHIGEAWWQLIGEETPGHARLRDWVEDCRTDGYSGLRLRGTPEAGRLQLWATTPDGAEFPFGPIDACGAGAAFFAAWPRSLWNWVPGHGLVVGYLTQVDRAEVLGRIDGLKVRLVTDWRQDIAVEFDRHSGQLWLYVAKLHLTRKRKLDQDAVLVDVGVALTWHLWVYPDASDEDLSDVAVQAGASWPWRHLGDGMYQRAEGKVGTAPGAVAELDAARH